MLAGMSPAKVLSGVSPFSGFVSSQKYRKVFRWSV